MKAMERERQASKLVSPRKAKRGAVEEPRPHIELVETNLGMVDKLPVGLPIETPLHPKRKRWSPKKYQTKCKTEESTSAEFISMIPDLNTTKPERPSTSAEIVSSLSDLKTSLSDEPSTSTGVIPEDFDLFEAASGSSKSPTKSSRQFIRCRRRLAPGKDAEISNLGSEEESDENDEDDTDTLATFLPRTVRAFFEADDEEWRPTSPIAEDNSSNQEEEPPLAARIEYGPKSMYNFEWREYSYPCIPPDTRREKFSQRKTGATAPYDDPYSAFVAIWDRQIMEYIAKETNRYAQQLTAAMMENGTLCVSSRITQWKDTDADELYVFFAILLTMGIVIKSVMSEYWSACADIFYTPGFKAHMPINRFLLINRCLHFVDNRKINPNMTSDMAKTLKVEPIISHLNAKFQELYTLDRNIALDESLTQWKGNLSFSRMMPRKVAKVGVKTYEICESKTGFLWRLEVHTGSNSETLQEVTAISGTVPTLVLRLLRGLEDKGYTVWMDSFFNSPALARTLKSKGFDCVGTFNTNRKFVPSELTNLDKKHTAVGEVYGCTSGDVDLLVWRDKNVVPMISTYHGMEVSKVDEVIKPNVVRDYNVCMGGVDKKDQMLASYPIERKRTKVWYKKMFKRLLNVSTQNACIMYKNFQGQPKQISNRQFRIDLIISLLSKHGSTTVFDIFPNFTSSNRPLFTKRALEHFPREYDFTGKGRERKRRSCAICSKRVTSYCPGCNVALCTYTCTIKYHSSGAEKRPRPKGTSPHKKERLEFVDCLIPADLYEADLKPIDTSPYTKGRLESVDYPIPAYISEADLEPIDTLPHTKERLESVGCPISAYISEADLKPIDTSPHKKGRLESAESPIPADISEADLDPIDTSPHKKGRLESAESPIPADISEADLDPIDTSPHKKGRLESVDCPLPADISEADLVVAVTSETTGYLSSSKANQVFDQLRQQIIDLAMDPNSTFGPQFQDKPVVADGLLKLSCKNTPTLEWLKVAIVSISVLNGEKLTVKRQSDIPRRIRCGILVPGQWPEARIIGRVLRMQNEWADLDRWLLHSTSSNKIDTFVIVSVPEDVAKLLLDYERQLSFSLGSVHVKFWWPDGKYHPDLPPTEIAVPPAYEEAMETVTVETPVTSSSHPAEDTLSKMDDVEDEWVGRLDGLDITGAGDGVEVPFITN